MTMTHNGSKAEAKGSRKKLTPAQLRVQIQAARLRVLTDSKLGKETPAWVKELAAREP